MEGRASAGNSGSFRPEHRVSLQSPVSEVPQHNLLSSSATVTTSQSKINITSSDTTTKEAEDKNQAPKALEKLEMMVAVMDVEAKRTEAETARRVEDLQNEEFLSETLGVVNMTNESVQISHSLPNDVVAAGNYSVKQSLLTNIHKSSQPEALTNEHVQSSHVMDDKIPERMHFKDGPELNSLKGSAVTNELIDNMECKGPESKNNISSRPEMKDELQKQENIEILNPELKKKDQDEQLRMKRQLQIEDRDRKLSDRKRMKNLHSDRKQNKKETTRNRTAKNKKFKLTDEAIVQSLKELPPLQLCEPEFLMPSLIIQPTLNGYHRQTVFRGSFGRSYITDVDDYYANKQFPDIKVCLDNPPTPPTSLPPSPTFTHSKEQRLYDMLVERAQHSTSMFPTPPYGGDSGVDVKNALPKEKSVDRSQRQRLGMFQDHSRTLSSHLGSQNPQHEVYPAFVIDKGLSVRSKPETSLRNDNDVNKIYSDVNVTLTIAAISDQTVHDTVNAISELIDADMPTKLTIEPPVRNVSAVYLESNERIGNPRFTENNIDERIVSGDSDVKKNQSGNGPYCRHCDVVILGIGVVRNNSTNGTKEGLNDDKTSNYSNINVEDGVNDGRDIFCSSACLKQYYSLDLSETSSVSKESSSTATTPEEELKTKGLTTSYKLVNENDGSMAVRGDEVAEETCVSLGKSQQKSLDEQNEVTNCRNNDYGNYHFLLSLFSLYIY